jgi:head-tail adaptor
MTINTVQLDGYFDTIHAVMKKWANDTGYATDESEEGKAVQAIFDIFEITVRNINDIAEASRMMVDANAVDAPVPPAGRR